MGLTLRVPLDFGFLTTVGNPRFEPPSRRASSNVRPAGQSLRGGLSEAFRERFGHDRDSFGLYRAAYAIISNSYFGPNDHDAWCVRMLRRPDVTGRTGGSSRAQHAGSRLDLGAAIAGVRVPERGGCLHGGTADAAPTPAEGRCDGTTRTREGWPSAGDHGVAPNTRR